MIDYLWPGGPRFAQHPGVFKLGTDSVMLAYFAQSVNETKQLRTADLGCGAGVLSIILAWNHPNMNVDAIDISEDAAALAAENAKLNNLESQINIFHGDIREYKEHFSAGAYDTVISNPPYYAPGSGKLPQDDRMMSARAERQCTLEDICLAAGYLARWGGSLFLVHKPERLSDIFRSMNLNGFEPKRLRFVQHRAASAPNLVLVEGRRGGKASINIEPPLILTCDDGRDSDEVKLIYKRGGNRDE